MTLPSGTHNPEYQAPGRDAHQGALSNIPPFSASSLAEALLDQPPLEPTEVIHLEQSLAHILGTASDIVLVQAEAIVALEAVARSVAGPGIVAINVVTGPYGAGFGDWMRAAGASVIDIISPFDEVASVDDVVDAIRTHSPQVVALVHAEAATGGTNDVAAIARAARDVGAIVVLDAVASIGAEPVPVDVWGIDLAIIGGQKGLAGPAGVSAVSVSARAWSHIEANAAAPRRSVLSLVDWRDDWLRTDKLAVPGMPSWLESRALSLAADRVRAEGMDAVNARHVAARAAAVAGIRALNLELWQKGEGLAPIATTVRIPEGAAGTRLRDGVGGIVSAGAGPLASRLLRINHFGRAANARPVADALERIAAVLGVDPAVALAASAAAWDAACD